MNPVFLIGAERSGTTLLRLMLDGHPQVAWLNEFEYAVDHIDSTDDWPDIGSYVEWLGTHRIFNATGFTVDRSLDYPSLVKSFLVQKQQRDQKPVIGATCHRHYDRLRRIFPQAKFIYLLRDPRDVARSNIGMGWAGNVWYGVERWIEAERLWQQVKVSIADTDYIELRYEALIATPEQTLTTISNFMGLNYDPQMLNYPARTTYSAPDPTLTEQWRRKLTPHELELVEYRAGELMEARGYGLASNSHSKPSSLELSFLAIQNKLYKIRFRIDRFGWSLFVSEFWARKLKLKGWEKMLRLRMNAIAEKHLK